MSEEPEISESWLNPLYPNWRWVDTTKVGYIFQREARKEAINEHVIEAFKKFQDTYYGECSTEDVKNFERLLHDN